MRKLGWLTVLLALFSVTACEKTKPLGKANEYKDRDGHEHNDGDSHEHKDGDKKK